MSDVATPLVRKRHSVFGRLAGRAAALAKCKPDRVTIIVNQAAGIRAGSSDESNRGSLFVEIKHGSQLQRSSYSQRQGGACTTWNETFELKLEFGCDFVEVSVMERFVFTTSFRGKVLLELRSFEEQERIYRNSYKLRGKKGTKSSKKSSISGCIGIQVVLWKYEEGKDVVPNEIEFEYEPRKMVKKSIFRLKRILKNTGCEAYETLLRENGFDDRGAFSLIDEQLLRDIKVYNKHHRKALLHLVDVERKLHQSLIPKKSTVTVYNSGNKDEVGARRQRRRRISVDGLTFYDTKTSLKKALEDHRKNPTVAPSLIEQQNLNRAEHKSRMKKLLNLIDVDDEDNDAALSSYLDLESKREKHWTPHLDSVLQHRMSNEPTTAGTDKSTKDQQKYTNARSALNGFVVETGRVASGEIQKLEKISSVPYSTRQQKFVNACSSGNTEEVTRLIPFMNKGELDVGFAAASSRGQVSVLKCSERYFTLPLIQKSILCGVSRDQFDVVQYLLPKLVQNAGSTDKVLSTALLSALIHGHKNIEQYLIHNISKDMHDRAYDLYRLKK